MTRLRLLVGLALAVGATPALAKPVADVRASDWRRVATDADRNRIREWRTTWLAAVAAARTVHRAGVAAEEQLLNPDRAVAGPIPPAGAYRCRTFKLGAKGTASPGFNANPWAQCRIDAADGRVAFAQVTGLQRPAGRIYQDGAARGIFLGTLALGEESGVLKYGRDPNRDMAGVVERVGPKRWRIAFPDPRFESQLDMVELVPTG